MFYDCVSKKSTLYLYYIAKFEISARSVLYLIVTLVISARSVLCLSVTLMISEHYVCPSLLRQ